MTRFLIFSLNLFLLPLLCRAEFWGSVGERRAFEPYVWEYDLRDFSPGQYSKGVKAFFASFERKTGKKLGPGEKRRVGIKVYTNSGSGLATPRALVRAVIQELLVRGYGERELFLLDVNENRLRSAGFIPRLSKREGNQFEGVPVLVLDSKKYYDPIWFYDSSLPSKSGFAFSPDLLGPYEMVPERDDRKSFLPKILLTEVDFWINIPMAMDHPAMGLSGALVNATLWNISNRDRFFASSANAPIATAEIAAIPELESSLAFTIMPLERYQFIGGPVFNSLYTRSDRLLWMSVNPVILDALVLERINFQRKASGFQSLGRRLPLLHFAESLGLGFEDIKRIRWVRLP